MVTYIHERPDWPDFRWDIAGLAEPLAAVGRRQGHIAGRMAVLGFQLRAEAELATLTEDVVKTSEIEGEILDRGQVRSSIARRLGIDIAGLPPADRHIDGVVDMMLDATRRCADSLTADRLQGWQAALFPGGRSGLARIITGAWRDDRNGSMQVVSGALGRERVHYQAPAAGRLDAEMAAFLAWFEGGAAIDQVLKAGLAHLWFVTIHPFEDGNGRIARAIADLALARAENGAQRFYSMSAQIRQERAAYYERLEATQKGDLDVTPWLLWFIACLGRAIDGAEQILEVVLHKARFWEIHRDTTLSDRQRKVINRLLDGFDGRLTTSRWAALTRTSQDTALRDIDDLLTRGILVRQPGGGRSSSYSLLVEDV